MEPTLLRRSPIAARSLSTGGIVGVSIGCAVAVALVFLCIFPFLRRAFRQRTAAHRHASHLPEMGQHLGPAAFAHGATSHSHRRLSTSHFAQDDSPTQDLGGAHPTKEYDFVPASAYPTRRDTDMTGPTLHHVPTAAPSQSGTQTPISAAANGSVPPLAPSSPAPDGRQATSQSHGTGSLHARTRASPEPQVTLDRSTTFASQLSSRDLSPITTGAYVNEPEDLEYGPGASPRRQHAGLAGSIPRAMRNLGHRAAAALHRSSTRSSSTHHSEDRRSPPLSPIDTLEPTISAPAIVEEADTEALGEAYSYYHDPEALRALNAPHPAGSQNISSTPVLAAGGPSSSPAPPQHGAPSRSEPLLTTSPTTQASLSPTDKIKADTPITPDVEAWRRDSIKPLPIRQILGPQGQGIKRWDSLPPQDIMADLPVPNNMISDAQVSEPSFIIPMEVMPASTDEEQVHKVKEELDRIANSPPPPVFVPAVYEPTLTPEPSPGLRHDAAFNGRDSEMLDISDLSTPPPMSHSSGPSVQNTPDTRLTEPFTITPSPSPRWNGDNEMHHNNDGPGQHQEEAGGDAGDATSRMFVCDRCNRRFNQIHRLNHHRRYHERPHECPYPDCDMRFGTKTHLDRHINDKHEKKKQYYCKIGDCPYSRLGGKSFPRKDNWRRHMMNKHNITPEADPGPEYVDDDMGGT